jgi:hypothetical protein
MVSLSGDWDPEAPGSRFTMRPAIALGPESSGDWRNRFEQGEQVAASAIAATTGDWVLEEQEGIGAPKACDADHGRGAGDWIPVLEWLGLNFVGPALAWDLVKIGVKRLAETVRRVRREAPERPIYVSRGMAVALAIEQVLEAYDVAEPLECEAAEDTLTLAGQSAPELGYAGIEPWLVILIDHPRRRRYLVIVGPDGLVRGHLETAMGPFEGMYSPLGPGAWKMSPP